MIPITLNQLQTLTALQAEDEMLWNEGEHIETAYVQQALRFLTRAIEGEWTFAETAEAIKEMQP